MSLSASITTDKTIYTIGDEVKVTATLTNNDTSSITILFENSILDNICQAFYIHINGETRLVKNPHYGKHYFKQPHGLAAIPLEIKSKETKSCTVTLNHKFVSGGEYAIQLPEQNAYVYTPNHKKVKFSSCTTKFAFL